MSTKNETAIVAEEINHDVVKRAAQHLIDRAEKFSMAELHKADMAGVVGLSLAYLDLASRLEAANEGADELQSRIDTVTASHCQMLREFQAERHRVDRLAELVESWAEVIKGTLPTVSQAMTKELTAIRENRI